MPTPRRVLAPVALLLIASTAWGEDPAASSPTIRQRSTPARSSKKAARLPRHVHTDRQWRALLTPPQYLVTRRKATEPAFTGAYWNHHDDGAYACVGCGALLFDSEAKFDSGTGWPSYFRAIDRSLIASRPDYTDGTIRTEVNCRVCDAHLGHVFNDGPRPTGLRFCINSAAIDFVPRLDIPAHADRWRIRFGLPDPDAPSPTDTASTPETTADSSTRK